MISRRPVLRALAGGAALAALTPGRHAAAQTAAPPLEDAVGLAERIKRGEGTMPEAVEGAIARAKAAAPGPIVTEFYQRGLDFASRLQAGGAKEGALLGVPFFVKDLSDVGDVRTTYGSRAYAENIAKGFSPSVQALLAVGAVPIGKSATSEFGLLPTVETLLGPVCANPVKPAHSAGGSSGGSAALVAAGVVPFAHGSDGGGSLRTPASYCGLFGFKPSRGAAVEDGPPDEPMRFAAYGCLSRTVRDTLAWLSASATAPALKQALAQKLAAPGKLRLRLVRADALGCKAGPEVQAALDAAAQACLAAGHEVVEAPLFDEGPEVGNAFATLWAFGALGAVEQVSEKRGRANLEALVEPFTLGLADLARSQGKKARAEAFRTLDAFAKRYAAAFAEADAYITPVTAASAPRLGAFAPSQPFASLWEAVQAQTAYTPYQNAVGAPGMSLPLHETAEGLPVGVHVCAAPGADAMLLALAAQLEAGAAWRTRRL